MPRYLVERTFAGSLNLLSEAGGANGGNAQEGVTWITSYVTRDRRRSWCLCDGPSPESIRIAARANGLPVDRITEVRVLDPYCLQSAAHTEGSPPCPSTV
jgi:Protein of unknown function (DUF4242)